MYSINLHTYKFSLLQGFTAIKTASIRYKFSLLQGFKKLAESWGSVFWVFGFGYSVWAASTPKFIAEVMYNRNFYSYYSDMFTFFSAYNRCNGCQ